MESSQVGNNERTLLRRGCFWVLCVNTTCQGNNGLRQIDKTRNKKRQQKWRSGRKRRTPRLKGRVRRSGQVARCFQSAKGLALRNCRCNAGMASGTGTGGRYPSRKAWQCPVMAPSVPTQAHPGYVDMREQASDFPCMHRIVVHFWENGIFRHIDPTVIQNGLSRPAEAPRRRGNKRNALDCGHSGGRILAYHAKMKTGNYVPNSLNRTNNNLR